jgi:hypothetical protein
VFFSGLDIRGDRAPFWAKIHSVGERRLAQQVVAAAAPAIVLPVQVDASMIGYEEQLSYLKSLLAVGDPALRDVVGLWLYGPGKLCLACSALLFLQHASNAQCSQFSSILVT